MSELPDSWAVAPLGDLLAAIVGGGTPSKANADHFRGSIPFMTVKDMHARFVEDTHDHITDEALAESASTLVPADTLIVASRMSLGKIVRPKVPVAINQDLKALFLYKDIDKTYIEYVWRANEAKIRALGTGTTVKGIRLDDIRGLRVPIAPSAEQTRIARQLDTLLARVNACIDHLNAIPELLKRLRQAVVDAATVGALTEDWRETMGGTRPQAVQYPWVPSSILEITVDLRYGTSKKCHYSSEGVGVLRIPNIASHGSIDLRDLKSAEFETDELARLSLSVGDLLIIRSNGSVELVGKASVVTVKEAGLLFAGYLMRLRVDSERALPDFVRLSLSAKGQREYIELTAKSTSGVNNLNSEELKAMPLLLPSLDEQREIVRRVNDLFHLADRIEARYTKTHEQSRRLASKVLSKAFRGDLMLQDSNDERADILLARIAAERKSLATIVSKRPTLKARIPRTPNKSAVMSKSRQDEDIKGQPYLANHLRRLGQPATAEALFKVAELPVADFYKQLVWEVTQGLIKTTNTKLEPGHEVG